MVQSVHGLTIFLFMPVCYTSDLIPSRRSAEDAERYLRIYIPFTLDVRLFVDVPAGVTQEEGHAGFLNLPYLRC